MAILEVSNLTVNYYTPKGIVRALDNVSLKIDRQGDILAVVGESGCGKSTLGYAIAGLLPENAEIVSGNIRINGIDITNKKNAMNRKARVAVIFQDALTALNPVLTIGEQIEEIFIHVHGLSETEAYRETSILLNKVGLSLDTIRRYPHELSGGQRQRVLIAMALALKPNLIVADEPTTALDVTLQAKILKLLYRLVKDNKIAMLYITHDLSLAAHMADYIAVMYAGEIVEYSNVRELFRDPKHPYTRALLNAIPRIDRDIDELKPIEGLPPSLINPPPGCRFHPRCPYAMEICKTVRPSMKMVNGNTMVRCLLYE